MTGAVAAPAARGLPHRRRPPGVVAGQLVLSASGSVPLVVGGVSLLAGSGGGRYWVLPGLIGALVGTVPTRGCC